MNDDSRYVAKSIHPFDLLSLDRFHHIPGLVLSCVCLYDNSSISCFDEHFSCSERPVKSLDEEIKKIEKQVDQAVDQRASQLIGLVVAVERKMMFCS